MKKWILTLFLVAGASLGLLAQVTIGPATLPFDPSHEIVLTGNSDYGGSVLGVFGMRITGMDTGAAAPYYGALRLEASESNGLPLLEFGRSNGDWLGDIQTTPGGILDLQSPGPVEMSGTDFILDTQITGTEQSAPASPSANGYRVYAVDVAGKTCIVALFNTGAAVPMACQV